MAKRKKKIEGNCHICGKYGDLTFEHVPPKSAFNKYPVVGQHITELIHQNDIENYTRGTIQQKGMGAYTLCKKCNNNTGRWYSIHYAEWARQGLLLSSALHKSNLQSTLFHIFHILPLNVLKQIICMFFSVNQQKFSAKQKDLVKFVLDRNEKYLPNDINIYTFYNISSRMRVSGVSARIDNILFQSQHKHMHVFSELTYPPFGYILTFDTLPPSDNLCSIKHFAKYDYNEYADIHLRVPILPISSYMPADFRSIK